MDEPRAGSVAGEDWADEFVDDGIPIGCGEDDGIDFFFEKTLNKDDVFFVLGCDDKEFERVSEEPAEVCGVTAGEGASEGPVVADTLALESEFDRGLNALERRDLPVGGGGAPLFCCVDDGVVGAAGCAAGCAG